MKGVSSGMRAKYRPDFVLVAVLSVPYSTVCVVDGTIEETSVFTGCRHFSIWRSYVERLSGTMAHESNLFWGVGVGGFAFHGPPQSIVL